MNVAAQRTVEALIRSYTRSHTDFLTIDHHAINRGARSRRRRAVLALLQNVIGEVVAVVLECPRPHLLADRQLVIHARFVDPGGYFCTLRARQFTLPRVIGDRGWNSVRTGR